MAERNSPGDITRDITTPDESQIESLVARTKRDHNSHEVIHDDRQISRKTDALFRNTCDLIFSSIK